jgi:iron-sulfur cluster assembly protein
MSMAQALTWRVRPLKSSPADSEFYLQSMSISLTTAAAERVRNFLTRRGHGVGLRLGVKKTGCSGFAYIVNYADDIGSNDIVFEDQGVKVIVDRDSLGYIDGTQVDFVKQGLNEAFRFRNPNVKGECGCGESFTV